MNDLGGTPRVRGGRKVTVGEHDQISHGYVDDASRQTTCTACVAIRRVSCLRGPVVVLDEVVPRTSWRTASRNRST